MASLDIPSQTTTIRSRILDESSYNLMCLYIWRSRRHENVEWKNKAYHFAVVRVESLVDQGELFTAKATLQIQQMAKHPRLVLSSRNHCQLTVS